MSYSIKEVAKKFDLSTYTLRYYDKEGLLPFVHRNSQGNRAFEEKDLEWINMICCLRNTNMSIAMIKKYINLCMEGTKTLQERERLLKEHKEVVEAEVRTLEGYLETINYKIELYSKQQQDGSHCKL